MEETSLDKLREVLALLIDPDHGLLEKLRRRNALSLEDKEDIRLEKTYIKRNQMLLQLVSRNKKFDEFLLALRDADQSHVANYIHYNGDYNKEIGSNWPLTETELLVLNENEDSLIDIINPDDGLLTKLLSEKVLNSRQMQTISSKPTIHERNSSLLSLIRRSSVGDYWKTIQCLSDTNQGHIADLLNDGGVVIDIHADVNMEGNAQNISDTEEQISSKLSEIILAKIPDSSVEATRRILNQIGLKVIAVKKGNSVVLYVYCKVMEDLNCVEQLITSGSINNILTEIFVSCLSSLVRLDVKTRINSDKLRTARKFITAFEIQQKSSIEVFKPTLSKTRLTHLPLEVLDIILKKATKVVKVIQEDVRHGVKKCLEIIIHFSSVEHCWLQRLSRRKLKNSFWSLFKPELTDSDLTTKLY